MQVLGAATLGEPARSDNVSPGIPVEGKPSENRGSGDISVQAQDSGGLAVGGIGATVSCKGAALLCSIDTVDGGEIDVKYDVHPGHHCFYFLDALFCIFPPQARS